MRPPPHQSSRRSAKTVRISPLETCSPELTISPGTGRGRRGAFTLVEMLVVMGIIVLLISTIGPALTAMKSAGDVNKAVYDIAGILMQSRAFAMSGSTYVYVGFEEVDANQSSTGTPQAPGVGRVGIAVVASKDGTAGYSVTAPTKSWPAGNLLGGSFSTVGKVQTFDNLHLVNLGDRPISGSMMRPPLGGDPVAIDPNYNLGDTRCVAVTSFTYPLGFAVNSGQYNFNKVVQFSPQGVARIQREDNSDVIAPWLEIGLQQTHGTTVATLTPPVSTGNVVAIQINGATGAVRIYRP